jgi:hypothetical protein
MPNRVQPSPELCLYYRKWFGDFLTQEELGNYIDPEKDSGTKVVQRCESGNRVLRTSLAKLAAALSTARGFIISEDDLICEPVAVAKFILNSWFHPPENLNRIEPLRDAIVKQITPFLEEDVVWDCPGKPYLQYAGPWVGLEGTTNYVEALLNEAGAPDSCSIDYVVPLKGNRALASGTQVLIIDRNEFDVEFKNTYTFNAGPSNSNPHAIKLRHYKNEFDQLELIRGSKMRHAPSSDD